MNNLRFYGISPYHIAVIHGGFRFILIPQCGHTSWNEFHTKDRFYEILKQELGF